MATADFNSPVENDVREELIEESLKGLNQIDGAIFTGGYRVQAREILEKLYIAAFTRGAWAPVDDRIVAATEAPRTTSEALGRPQVARGRSEAQEKASVTAQYIDEMDAWSELRGWWEQTAHDEIAGLIAKMVEYGGMSRATDLTDIGRQMVNAGVTATSVGPGDRTEAAYQELGAYFYLVGKFARWTAAIREGRPVSDDTLHDIAIYTRMVQRIRAVGGWPV